MYSFINYKFRRAFNRMVRKWFLACRLDKVCCFKEQKCVVKAEDGSHSSAASMRRISRGQLHQNEEELEPFNNNKDGVGNGSGVGGCERRDKQRTISFSMTSENSPKT